MSGHLAQLVLVVCRQCGRRVGARWARRPHWHRDAQPLHRTAIRIAETKLALPAPQAFARGVLANMLVCFAVRLAMTSQSASGKLVGIMFPISAFVALGFEHSIANLFLIPSRDDGRRHRQLNRSASEHHLRDREQSRRRSVRCSGVALAGSQPRQRTQNDVEQLRWTP